MSYLYWQKAKLSDNSYYHTFCDKKLPTYPHAMRFETSHDLDMYLEAKKQFIQSTKIPASCDKCPLSSVEYDCTGYNATIMCRVIWRKIWEYVK